MFFTLLRLSAVFVITLAASFKVPNKGKNDFWPRFEVMQPSRCSSQHFGQVRTEMLTLTFSLFNTSAVLIPPFRACLVGFSFTGLIYLLIESITSVGY